MKTDFPLLTVTQLTQAIKLNLESMFPNIYLQGEISNLKIQSSGHIYFSLKDTQAQISVVMFKNEATFLQRMPKAGDHVMVKGEINVYPPKGNYQLIIRELSYMGLGELLQKLEQLKIKLHKMGWFKTSTKKKLPALPKRIGVVTSPTGAVIQDILHILSRRFSGFHLILNPVKVQGEGAAMEIAQAIQQFNQHNLVDVIIVGRGGGSLEDLWAFNEEIVAAAIYNSHIPIISAVGHETDHCIADYVADVRAPTPSAAAEIVISEKGQLLEYLASLRKRMLHTIMNFIQKDRHRLKSLTFHPLIAHPKKILEWRFQRLDDFRSELQRTIKYNFNLKKQDLLARAKQSHALKPINQIFHFRKILNNRNQVLDQLIRRQLIANKDSIKQIGAQLNQYWLKNQLNRKNLFNKNQLIKHLDQLILEKYHYNKQRFLNAIRLLEAFDPKNLLQKGYSILFTENKLSVINSVDTLTNGMKGRLLMSDGELLITINKIIRNNVRSHP